MKPVLSSLLLVTTLALPPAARAASGPLSLTVELGPISGASNDSRTISFDAASRTKMKLFDLMDGQEHKVRGVSFTDLLARLPRPRAADTAIFQFNNGMKVPVRLDDKDEVRQLFIALEHDDGQGGWQAGYFLAGRAPIPCPKVVSSGEGTGYSIWRYTSQLVSIRLVTGSAYQAILAQPTRQLPSHPGWRLYARHCQPCHGLGGQGATRGPDFISDLDAYRRIPPLAEGAAVGEPPSLHDKVKGKAGGQMPTLDHVSPAEITSLWRWLHSVHAGATK